MSDNRQSPRQDGSEPETEALDELQELDALPAYHWIVLKFGGTSVSTLANWEHIAATLKDRLTSGRHRLLVVCSALSQVSNRLASLLATATGGGDIVPGLGALHTEHARLAEAMDLDADEHLGDLFRELERVLEGLRLTREETPRLRARVMSAGELLSTRLGSAWLRTQGLAAGWADARELLTAEETANGTPERQYLSATCRFDHDPEVEARLSLEPVEVVVTQGFMARLPGGDTVLLGRGGSDTAAAYLAAKLGADHLEIWTDVPGMFTANPHHVPEARLLRRLGYAEAQELAAKGAKVLHPRCIRAAQSQGIPIHIRCTPSPELVGTVISGAQESAPQVKAVSARKGIVLVSMDVEGDWQPVGLIADIAARFKSHGLSIDLLASSQTNFTVALDPAANRLDDAVLKPLLHDLKDLCEPRLVQPAASVSLVGTGIRAILHEWAPVLECFEDESVYMVSQAANNLSLTFVVDEAGADRLVRKLHGEVFSGELPPRGFGPTWSALLAQARVTVD